MGPVSNAFPLAAFLISLQGIGVRATLDDYGRIALVLRTGGGWTIERLRAVLASLLCRDPAWQPAFDRRFDEFFDRALGAHGGEIDVQRVLAELRKLAPEDKEKSSEAPATRHSIQGVFRRVPPRLRSGIGATILIMVLAGGYAGYLYFDPDPPSGPSPFEKSSPPPPPSPLRPPTVPPAPPPAPLDDKETRHHLYSHIPGIDIVTEATDLEVDKWRAAARIAGLLLLAVLVYGAWLRYYRRPPKDLAPAWNEHLPRWFDPGAIGGKYPPRLTPETLDDLADALGYFQSEQSGVRLDVPASVAATADQGGIPTLRFQRRKRLRQVLVLEDTYAEALAWNPILGELAAGLSRRGIPVLYGRFRGVPDRFRTPEGAEVLLEDLEDERHAHLLLIFSDGKGLRRGRDRFLLEDLARWPLVAWMELRETRHWDESAAVPALSGLPVHPATADGLLGVMGRLMTEQAAGIEPYADPYAWTGPPPRAVGVPLSVHLERLLGDALLWAHACAMMMPPLTPALAEGLRRRFHPEVTPERLERLYTVAGTTTGGLVFPPAVLAALRRGFVERRSEEQQAAVLAFLLEAIEAAEPEEKESPAHLCWEWRYHRLRLEVEPDAALRRLSELAAGPLGRAIRAELGRAAVPGHPGPEDVGSAAIPLRALPGTRRGLQRLFGLAEHCGVSRREAYPVGRGHTVAVSVCGFGGVALAGAALWLYLQTGIYIHINVPDTLKRIAIILERRAQDGEWQQERSFPEFGPTSPGPNGPDTGAADKTPQVRWPLDPGSVYRVKVFAEGRVVARELDPGSKTTAIGFESKDRLLCSEEFRSIGLVVDRCPAAGPVRAIRTTPWAEPPGARTTNRLMSIGLEVRTDTAQYPELDELAEALLKTGSLDLLYRVRPATDGIIHRQEVLNRIKADFGPWLHMTQLIAWSAGQDAEGQEIAGFGIDRALFLGQGADGSWVQPLLAILSSEATRQVTEAEILALVKTAEASGPGAPVTLLAGGASIVSRPTPLALVGDFRDTLKDGSQGPAMVEIPAGTFNMGDSQVEGDPDELPVHDVEIDAPFALGQVEVTVAEFRQFVETTGYRKAEECLSWSSGVFGYKEGASWRNPGFGQDDGHPVVCVSWDDARAYAQWLSEQSGYRYRLPTEAEWEYAARAGTETSYWWGDEVGRNRANCDGCGSRWDGKSTAPAGSFAANRYRLHDTAGNAWEWVEDCWHERYAGAPTDGSVWTAAECAQRVIRGGSWFNLPTHLRSANRGRSTPVYRIDFVGFRLARTLE